MTILLTVLIGIVQLALGFMGVYVSLDTPEQKHNRYWIGAFVIIGLAGVALTLWLARVSDDAQQKANDEIHKAQVAATNANVEATKANSAATAAAKAATDADAETVAARAEARNAQHQLTALQIKTAGIAQRAVEATTGGKSYPRVRVSFGGSDPSRIGLVAEIDNTEFVGSFAWQLVQLEPAGDDPLKKAFCFAQTPGRVISAGDTGPLQPRGIPTPLPVTLTPAPKGVTEYRIVMEAKNGMFVQCLDVRPGDGSWDSKSIIWLKNIPVLVEKWTH